MLTVLRLLRPRSGRVVRTRTGVLVMSIMKSAFEADCLIGSNICYSFMASGFGTSATCKHARGTGEEIKGSFPTDRCTVDRFVSFITLLPQHSSPLSIVDSLPAHCSGTWSSMVLCCHAGMYLSGFDNSVGR